MKGKKAEEEGKKCYYIFRIVSVNYLQSIVFVLKSNEHENL